MTRHGRKSYRIPNLVIAGRVALAFVAVALLGVSSARARGVGVALTVLVIAMDGLDGFVARRLELASELGSVLDITADRIVEHLFWISFAVAHQVGLWVPLVVMTRSFLVDAVRGMALARGRTAFGEATMMRSPVTRFLASSRLMRTTYGAAKVAAFVFLGLSMTMAASGDGPAAPTYLDAAAGLSVAVAVALCLVRGVPVVVEGRAYLAGPLSPTGGQGPA